MNQISKALDAYRSGLAVGTGSAGGIEAREAGGSAGASFGDLVGRALEDTLGTQRQSETVSADAVAGTADMNEVVAAVNNAELTLQAVVAVRDKVVQAYQEILRMPI